MSAASIVARVKSGLAKAGAAVGSPSDIPIYLVTPHKMGNPLSPVTIDEVTLLPNAIFKSYDQSLIDGNIRAGDRQLVSNGDKAVSQNDIIRQGEQDYVVISVDKKAPDTVALAYISQCREQ